MDEPVQTPGHSFAGQWLAKIRWSHLIVAALAFGVLIRLIHFGFGRMLWLDEATIAINFIGRDTGEFFQPLDFRQIAPAYWMILMDAFWTLFQNLEYGLRLPSLLAGLGAFFVFWRMVQSRFSPAVVLITVFALAFSYMPVYYSAEIKPYIFDLLLAALLLWQGLRLVEKEQWSLSDISLIGITIIVGSSLAMAAPIIIGGIGGVLGLKALLDRQWRSAAILMLCGTLAAIIYLVPALSSYQAQIDASSLDQGGMGNFFERHFAPFPPTSFGDLAWYVQIVQDTFSPMFGEESTYVIVVLMLIGTLLLVRQSIWKTALILAPIGVGLMISAVHIYPIMSRLALYLIPIALLLSAYALEKIIEELPQRTNWIVIFALFLMNIGSVTWHRYYDTFTPQASPKDLSTELRAISEQMEPDEILVVTAWALPAFLLYRHAYDLDQVNWTVASRAECFFSPPIDIETRDRVWYLKGPFDARGPERTAISYDLIVDETPKRLAVKRIGDRLERLMIATPTPAIDYSSHCPQRKVEEVYLMGGNAPLHNE